MKLTLSGAAAHAAGIGAGCEETWDPSARALVGSPALAGLLLPHDLE